MGARGCHLYPDCLECPLEVCIHDRPVRSANRSKVSRIAQAQALYFQGATESQVSEVLGISLRTAYRYRSKDPG